MPPVAQTCVQCGKRTANPADPLGVCPNCLTDILSSSTIAWDTSENPPATSPAFLPNPDLLKPGMRLGHGRYELKELRGRGGQGQVWLAIDHRLREEHDDGSDGSGIVALKFLSPEIRDNPAALRLLKREVLLGRELRHDNIVAIFEWHEFHQEPVFIAMEHVEGEPLSKRIRRQPGGYFAWSTLRPLARQLCDAVYYLHGRGRVHCDIKPANLLISPEGTIKLIDLGLAKIAAEGGSDPSEIATGGTLAYMSPQRRLGQPATREDDVFALGSTLHELLTGSPPLSPPRGSPIEPELWPEVPVIDDVLSRRGPCDVPPEVQATIQACLSFPHDDRPTTYEVIQRMGLDSATHAAESAAESSRRPRRRQLGNASNSFASLGIGLLLGLVIVLIAVGLAYLWRSLHPAPQSVSRAQTPIEPPANRPPPTDPPPSTFQPPQETVPTASPTVTEPIEPPPPITPARTSPAQSPAVLSPPNIDPQPRNAEALPGESIEFRIGVLGDAPTTYQWFRRGEPLEGQTGPVLGLASVTETDIGPYYVSVRNSAGTVTSETAQLSWVLPKGGSPWTNSLRQAFVPVPVPGLPSLVGATEVSIGQFTAFVRDTRLNQGQLPRQLVDAASTNHPVSRVTWLEATNFCHWLTLHERRAGRLGIHQRYRLPTEAEWTTITWHVVAALRGETANTRGEPSMAPPQSWWPERDTLDRRFANLAGRELNADSAMGLVKTLTRYRYEDDFVRTAPVDSQEPLGGLYHWIGNVHEWCADSPGGGRLVVARGAAWNTGELADLSPTQRWQFGRDQRDDGTGFRVLLDPEASSESIPSGKRSR